MRLCTYVFLRPLTEHLLCVVGTVLRLKSYWRGVKRGPESFSAGGGLVPGPRAHTNIPGRSNPSLLMAEYRRASVVAGSVFVGSIFAGSKPQSVDSEDVEPENTEAACACIYSSAHLVSGPSEQLSHTHHWLALWPWSRH